MTIWRNKGCSRNLCQPWPYLVDCTVFVPLGGHGQTVVVVDGDLLPNTDRSHGHQGHHQPKPRKYFIKFYPTLALCHHLTLLPPCQFTSTNGWNAVKNVWNFRVFFEFT